MKYESNNKWVIVIGVTNEVIYSGFFDIGQIETLEVVKFFDTENEMNQYIIDNSLILPE